MNGAVSALLILLPATACAEGLSTGQDYSFLSSFLQMVAALFIVIGLILITRHFSGKLINTGVTGRFGSRHIRVVETRALSPKQSLILVEVGGEYLLLASGENGLRLVKQVEIYEDIEVLDDDPSTRPGKFDFLRRFAKNNRSA